MAVNMSKELLELWAGENPRIAAFTGSDYLQLLMQAYEALDTSSLYHSRTHGQWHIERTMLLGAMIAHGEKLPMDISRLLLLCCSYHDVGRVSDWMDRKHGQRSAEKISTGTLKEKFSAFSADDFNLCLAAICAHSLNDKLMGEIFERYSIPSGLQERYMLLACSLKDADNLDRVRIRDLNPAYLRSLSAKAMAEDAQWIFDRFNQPR